MGVLSDYFLLGATGKETRTLYVNADVGVTLIDVGVYVTAPPTLFLFGQGRAKSAQLTIDAAPGATAGAIIARYWLDGTNPSATEGLPLRDGDVIEIHTNSCLFGLRIFSVDDRPHKINVQYFNYSKIVQ